ncbi:MAG TPA: hypothetical protein VIS96_04360 [Terrimicrobiaceae bacterium]
MSVWWSIVNFGLDATAAYDAAAIEHFGAFARPNGQQLHQEAL